MMMMMMMIIIINLINQTGLATVLGKSRFIPHFQ